MYASVAGRGLRGSRQGTSGGAMSRRRDEAINSPRGVVQLVHPLQYNGISLPNRQGLSSQLRE